MYYSNTLDGLTMRLQSLAKSDKVITNLRVKRQLSDDNMPTWQATWTEKIVK